MQRWFKALVNSVFGASKPASLLVKGRARLFLEPLEDRLALH